MSRDPRGSGTCIRPVGEVGAGVELRWAWTPGHDVSIKLSPLGGGWVGADSGLQAETWRWREAAMAGGRLGTETAGTSPATNNSPPQTAQWGALDSAWLGGLGRRGRKGVTVSLPPPCVWNGHLPPGAHPLSEVHTLCTRTCTGTHGGEAAEGDGGSRWQLSLGSREGRGVGGALA